MKRTIIVNGVFMLLTMCATSALAQEGERHELSVQGTGFFTKDVQENGTLHHATDTGGLLVGYRFRINHWFAAEASYGYARNAQQSFSFAGPTSIQSDIHEATGALVLNLPINVARMRPYALAGAGALVFDPTGNTGGFAPGAQSQAKAAFVYGAGVDYRISNHIALRAEYRGLVYNRPDFDLAGADTNVTTHTAQPSAGIVFRF